MIFVGPGMCWLDFSACKLPHTENEKNECQTTSTLHTVCGYYFVTVVLFCTYCVTILTHAVVTCITLLHAKPFSFFFFFSNLSNHNATDISQLDISKGK